MVFTPAHRAAVEAAFAPLIARAVEARWARETKVLRETVEVGVPSPPKFWRDFALVCSNVITVRQRIAKHLGIVERTRAEQMMHLMRAMPGDIAPHATSVETLIRYLDATATLYSDAMALAIGFGECGRG